MSRTGYPQAVRDRAAALYAGGLTHAEVVLALASEGCRASERTVRRWLQGQSRHPGPRPRADIDTAAVAAMSEAGGSPGEISRALGVPRSTVQGRLRDAS